MYLSVFSIEKFMVKLVRSFFYLKQWPTLNRFFLLYGHRFFNLLFYVFFYKARGKGGIQNK